MDSLTQIVLGAAVGDIVLGKKVGNKALLWGAVAGTIPDLDVFVGKMVDPITANLWHRGFSHSLLFSLLCAPLLGWLIHRVYKRKWGSWKDWTMLSFWSLVTHPLLDAHTAWGTQFFWPLDLRLAFKNIFVIDPLYTLPFLVCTILAMRISKDDPKRTLWSKRGLMVSTAYLALSFTLKAWVYLRFESALERQQYTFIDLETRPSPMNTILWSCIVEQEEHYLIGHHSLLADPEGIRFYSVPKNHHLLEPYLEETLVQDLIYMAQGHYVMQEKEGQLIFNDLRFGQSGFDNPEAEFIYSYNLSWNGEQLSAVERPKSFEEGGEILKELWLRIKGKG